MQQGEREYDVVVWGATGYTGRLVAHHMAARARATGLRWAVAGRNAGRLEELKRELATVVPNGDEGVGVLLADSNRAADMEALASSTRVVLANVGPFIKYGTTLVAACVKCGTHYADITGETPWVRQLIDDFHEEAARKGLCIVPMSGFDSVPADIGTFMLADYVAKKYGAKLANVEAVVRSGSLISGGTASTMMELADMRSAGVKGLHYPFLLNPRGQWSSIKTTSYDKQKFLPHYQPLAQSWTSLFVMAAANTRVVRRTNALLGDVYGPKFHYNEFAKAKSLLAAILTTVVMIIFGLLVTFRITREGILKRILPAPGQGPSDEVREKLRFSYEIYGEIDYSATTGQKQHAGPKAVKAVVAGRGPYTETAVMVAEIGIALAERSARGEKLPVDPAAGRGGILTPAACLGSQLVQRLQAAGLQLSVEDL